MTQRNKGIPGVYDGNPADVVDNHRIDPIHLPSMKSSDPKVRPMDLSPHHPTRAVILIGCDAQA
jgi:hypothetical protein